MRSRRFAWLQRPAPLLSIHSSCSSQTDTIGVRPVGAAIAAHVKHEHIEPWGPCGRGLEAVGPVVALTYRATVDVPARLGIRRDGSDTSSARSPQASKPSSPEATEPLQICSTPNIRTSIARNTKSIPDMIR
jgi:hypothetical protein